MAIVTITSDWGKGDYYLGQLKGRLLTALPGVNISEISNSIPPHDVQNEAFIVKNCYKSYPLSTIHLLAVFCEPYEDYKMVILYNEGHYFIGLNDGRFSHIFENPPSIAFEIIDEDNVSAFRALELFTKGVKIINDNSFEENTRPSEVISESVRRTVYDDNTIIGRVVYIDSYGNAVTNIEKQLFERIGKKRNYTIYIQGPYLKTDCISLNYNDINAGKLIVLFNSLNLLEVSIIAGNLSILENVDTTTEVRIKFINEKREGN